MHPKLALNRQTVEKRIDEVCLTSANPSPKVETALWPLGSAQKPLGSAPNGVLPRNPGQQSCMQVIQLLNDTRLSGIRQ
jgi:hypothetical protein